MSGQACTRLDILAVRLTFEFLHRCLQVKSFTLKALQRIFARHDLWERRLVPLR